MKIVFIKIIQCNLTHINTSLIAGVASALHLYFSEIFLLCSTSLDSSKWTTKSQSARSLSYMIEKQHNDSVVTPHLNDIIKVMLSLFLTFSFCDKIKFKLHSLRINFEICCFKISISFKHDYKRLA